MAAIELGFFQEAIAKAKNNSQAAKLLGIPRSTFCTRLEALISTVQETLVETHDPSTDTLRGYHVFTVSGVHIGSLDDVVSKTTNEELFSWVCKGTVIIIYWGD